MSSTPPSLSREGVVVEETKGSNKIRERGDGEEGRGCNKTRVMAGEGGLVRKRGAAEASIYRMQSSSHLTVIYS